jgi:hypothetical protein
MSKVQKHSSEINIGGPDYLTIKTSTIVTMNEYFTVYTQEEPVNMKVEITADFADIPEKYHEICFNLLTAKYANKVTFGENPFSECKPVKKRKWYQFWKAKYFSQ